MGFHWKKFYGNFIKQEENVKVNKQALGSDLEIYSNQSTDEILANFESSINGLSETEAEKRLIENGPNEIKKEQELHWSLDLLFRFKSPINLLLIGLAIASYFMGDEDSP